MKSYAEMEAELVVALEDVQICIEDLCTLIRQLPPVKEMP